METLYQYLLVWILFWLVGWSGAYLIPRKRFDYIKNYLTVSVYFFIISAGILYSYKDITYPMLTSITIFPFAILVLFFLINFLSYYFSNNFLKRPVELLGKYSGVDFLKLDYRYLMSKSFEILYQQVLIIVLVLMLHSFGLNLFYITIIFAIMFGFGHLPAFKFHKDIFGLIIFIAALSSSFLFPYLILNFKYGFIYTYIAHWLFYSNTGILFWLLNQKSADKIKEIVIKPLMK